MFHSILFIEFHAPTSSTQKLKLMGRDGQFTYIPTLPLTWRLPICILLSYIISCWFILIFPCSLCWIICLLVRSYISLFPLLNHLFHRSSNGKSSMVVPFWNNFTCLGPHLIGHARYSFLFFSFGLAWKYQHLCILFCFILNLKFFNLCTVFYNGWAEIKSCDWGFC